MMMILRRWLHRTRGPCRTTSPGGQCLAAALGFLMIHVVAAVNEECAPCQHGSCVQSTCRCSGIWQGPDCSDDSARHHPLHIFYLVYESLFRVPVLVWCGRVMYQRHVQYKQPYNAADATWACVTGMVLSTWFPLIIDPTLDESEYDRGNWVMKRLFFFAYLVTGTMSYFLVLHGWRKGIAQYTKLANASLFLRIGAASMTMLTISHVFLLIPATQLAGGIMLLAWTLLSWISIISMVTVYGRIVLRILKQVSDMDEEAQRMYRRIKYFRIFYLSAFIPFILIPLVLAIVDPYPTGLRYTIHRFAPNGISYFMFLLAFYLTQIERDRRRRVAKYSRRKEVAPADRPGRSVTSLGPAPAEA